MRNIVEIIARLEEAERLRDEWIAEVEKAKKTFESDDYLEHCYGIIRDSSAEVTVLKWILGRQ